MNAVITVNHFCEVHGPQVLFCTQTFHDPTPFNVDGPKPPNEKPKNRRFYGNLELLRGVPGLIPQCEACRSLEPKISGLLSSDHDSRTSFLSGQNPIICAVASLAKHACLRSLSCEISRESKDDPEKPVFFGDTDRGHVLSMAFSIKDAQGRGFRRNYSICVLSLDALMLLQSWPFLTKNMQTIISELQEMASKVYQQEQEACPQRALRLNASSKSEESKCNKTARSVIELTGESLVFFQLHNWFVWLLKAGANRLQEKLALPPFLKNIGSFGSGIETEDGFVLVPTSSSLTLTGDTADHRGVHELEASCPLNYPLLGPSIPGGINELYLMMGRNQFLLAAHALLVGHQLVLQCEWPSMASAVIQCFKCIATRAIFKPQLWSHIYYPPSDFTLLGVSKSIKLPVPLPSNSALIEIIKNESSSKTADQNNMKFQVKAAKAPARWPTLLVKMDKALQNSFLTPTALHCHFVALKEEWLNISRTLIRLHQTGKSQSDLAPLMTALGAQSHDWPLIRYWGVLHATQD